jgi:hypothetical protein
MGKLRELLATEAEKFKKEKEDRQRTLTEWRSQLDDLFKQLDGWLAASDPEGLLDVTKEPVTINDPALGEYKAPSRRIVLGDKFVEIVPRARYVLASICPHGSTKTVRAHGLVEIRTLAWASHELYQLPSLDWYIRNTSASLRESNYAVEPLDADRFEAALASLLR